MLYYTQDQYAQAEPLYKRALAIVKKALGPHHPDITTDLNNLAALYKTQDQYAQAEPLYKRTLTIMEKALSPHHPYITTSLNNLTALYKTQGQYAQTEPLYKRSLAIYEKALGPHHPDVALSLNNLAELYRTQGQYASALSLVRRASTIYHHRIIAGGSDNASAQEATKNRNGFFRHLSLLAQNPDQEAATQIADESFQIVQLAQASGTDAAVAKMAARFAKDDDAIAILVKRKQDAVERRAKAEASMLKTVSQTPDKRNPATEQQLRDAIAGLSKDIVAVDAALDKRFPEYQELTRPEPLTIRQAQALLRPNEAMLMYAIANEQSWLWIMRQKQATFLSLNAKQATLAEQIKELRTQTEIPDTGQLHKVDVATLHTLYRQLFTPALPHLKSVQHLIMIPAGPLQSLPLSMLVASKPKVINNDIDYREVD